MIRIRDFNSEDFNIYFEMSKSFYESAASVEHVNPNHCQDSFKMIIHHSPYIRGLMIEYGREVVGYALLGFYWCNELDSIIVLIDELFIEEKHRGKKIGTYFFKELEKLYSLDEYSFQLEVNPKNERVFSLYKKMGYRVSPYVALFKN